MRTLRAIGLLAAPGALVALACLPGCGSPGPALQGSGYVLQGATRVPGNLPASVPAPLPGALPTQTGTPPRYGATAPSWGPGVPAQRPAPYPPQAQNASPAPVYPPTNYGTRAPVYPAARPAPSPGAVTASPPAAYPPPAAGIGSPPPGAATPPPGPAYPPANYGTGAPVAGTASPLSAGVPAAPPGVFAPITPGLAQAARPLPAQRPLGQKELALDSDHDGVPDTWFTITDGRITGVRRDTDKDGKVDFTSSFSPDEGLPTSEVQYRGDTGQVAAKTEFDAGVKRKREADDNGDGKPDHWWYYLGGELSKEAWDRDGDGRIDEARHYRKGQVARIEYDADHDGKFERTDYLKNGRVARSEILDQDGILTRVYDAQGVHVVREERDADGDGTAERVTILSPSGEKLREDRDLNGDGRPDVSAYYEGGKLVRREISGTYLRAQKTPDSAAPSVDVEKRDFRKLSGS